jgi:hypothetical protein
MQLRFGGGIVACEPPVTGLTMRLSLFEDFFTDFLEDFFAVFFVAFFVDFLADFLGELFLVAIGFDSLRLGRRPGGSARGSSTVSGCECRLKPCVKD